MRENNVIWTVEGKIKSGMRADLDSLMAEMVGDVIKEEGTTNYEWTLAEDGETLHVYERYANTEEAKKHLVTWGRFAERFMSIVDVYEFVVFCDLAPELKEAVAGLNPKYMLPIGGFAK